jgi:integrase/recombinase XerD
MYMKEKGLKTVSINSRLRAVRAFFNFLERRTGNVLSARGHGRENKERKRLSQKGKENVVRKYDRIVFSS